ncbi:YugN-like family protein [Fictibacillus phosphorivorans]|uniref:YugN-like family protein n=1 Tax=Fictibacillus phosphorivorans TaxID=1221500 RepID=UPI00203D882E|nr:YugN-like family protein [Fictibacillus phosphorivorans]MCM3718731.1 YugN-like family protein [Fictibacillus phosphorivorans]MCM3776354.1 YugN-like family protein [Fictibacillus phosphorivorans]
MKPIKSKLENEFIALNEAEDVLKKMGFSYGGNWDYDHGYFDYKLDDEVGYTFLRIPFIAVEGELDRRDTTIQMGEPFLLAHKYQIGLDDHAEAGNISGSVNQFAEPQDPDATIDKKWIGIAKELVQKVEAQLLK